MTSQSEKYSRTFKGIEQNRTIGLIRTWEKRTEQNMVVQNNRLVRKNNKRVVRIEQNSKEHFKTEHFKTDQTSAVHER